MKLRNLKEIPTPDTEVEKNKQTLNKQSGFHSKKTHGKPNGQLFFQ